MLERKSGRRLTAALLGATLALSACGGDNANDTNAGPAGQSKLAGTISGDGSSTVFPIMEAVGEDFPKLHPDVKIQVALSGTGGGFEKFCNGETDFANASRAIKDKEVAACKEKGVDFTEFKIASDGLSVVTNKDLAIDCLTVDELKKLWIAGSTVKKYSDLRAGLPDTQVQLFGPGADSGTYDFFQEEILGEDEKFRTGPEVSTSEDDNQLVKGIEGSPSGLGYFGFAYYLENEDKLNLVGVDGGNGCQKPSKDSVRDGGYTPLSRPLFVYVKNSSLARSEVKEMMRYLLTDGRKLIDEVGYIELTDDQYAAALAKVGGTGTG